jgi:uncharacterized membrane protein
MIVIVVFAVVCVISCIMAHKRGDMDNFGWVMAGAASGVPLFLMILVLWLNPAMVRGKIAEYHAVKATIARAREVNISELERAALTQKIIEVNAEIASAQYYNRHGFDIYIPDEVEDLEYLK